MFPKPFWKKKKTSQKYNIYKWGNLRFNLPCPLCLQREWYLAFMLSLNHSFFKKWVLYRALFKFSLSIYFFLLLSLMYAFLVFLRKGGQIKVITRFHEWFHFTWVLFKVFLMFPLFLPLCSIVSLFCLINMH